MKGFIGTCAALYGASGRKYYLTAAPGCPYPDPNLDQVLQAAGQAFDFVSMMLYGNSCSASKDSIVTGFNSWTAL
jgi:hypothetical protein